MDSASLSTVCSYLQGAQLNLILPLFLSWWMAWSDMRTNRIPNYLTLGCALAGLGYQLGFHGWAGLAQGFLGLGLGFALLIIFYWMGGMGAGDVKALAALGTWLGPQQTLSLFVYMAFSGVLVVIIFLWRKGLLKDYIRYMWGLLVNWVLLRPHPSMPRLARPGFQAGAIPYAVALAMGMAILCWRSFKS